MDVYTFTYSDDYDIPDIMDGTITSWMISFSLYIYIIHGTWNGYVLHVLLAKIFFADDIQMAHDRALLWISMANPFLWMTAARCANAAAGISSGCVLARGKNVSCI